MPTEWGNGRSRRREDDLFAEVRDLVDAMRARMRGGDGADSPRGGKSVSPWPFVAIGLVLYLATGFFIVDPDQRGIVLRFGEVAREVGPGPGYHLPWPFEQVLRPSVTQIRKEEFGFRTIDTGPPARYRSVDQEALMLTGDENIVKLQFIVQYRVKPEPEAATDFLFNVRDPQDTVRSAAEAAMRQVVGSSKIDDALTEERERIQVDTQAGLQKILDQYDSGLEVVTVKLQDVEPPAQVSDAFKDVISAQQDRERMINEARGYANDVVPKARGQAAQLLNEAEGYRLAKIQEASGAAARFVALHEEYAKAPDVTRLRIYLETMEDILPRMDKIVIDQQAGDKVVPYLPLDRVLRPRGEQTSADAAGR